MDTDEFVAATMRRVAASAVPPAREALTPAPARRWTTPLVVLAAAAVVALILAAAGLVGAHRSGGGPGAGSKAAGSPRGTACRVEYRPTTLPSWARVGFTPPTQPVPHVRGDRGDMAAILWSTHHPLVAPPAADRNNKILWVARVGAAAGPLHIRATLVGTGKTVTRTVRAAPGPSIIDLPAAGCWSFDLRWGSHRDHLDLGYAAR